VLLVKWLAPFGTDLCVAERETYGRNIGIWRSKSILLAAERAGILVGRITLFNVQKFFVIFALQPNGVRRLFSSLEGEARQAAASPDVSHSTR